jgi:hypothetical protein
MNPNSTPQQPQPEFTEESLNKKFSYSFSRKQLIILVNALRPIQLPVGDLRSKVLREILEEVELTAIQSITSSDYVQPTPEVPVTPLPATEEVATN